MITGPVYFDYAAATPVDAEVAHAMSACLTDAQAFGNPSSGLHAFGREAEAQVERARLQVASLIGARADEIIWTAGATEADNLAILGAARFRADRSEEHTSELQSH